MARIPASSAVKAEKCVLKPWTVRGTGSGKNCMLILQLQLWPKVRNLGYVKESVWRSVLVGFAYCLLNCHS